MKRLILCILAGAVCHAALSQQVATLVAPFDSSRTGGPQLGEKTAMILNLQIWQTLRIPSTPEGRNSSGTVLWETFSDAPRDEAEVRKLASSLADHPRLVLWGRAWRYGKGTVVEAFLLVRGQNEDASFAKEVWTVALSPTTKLTVSVPRTEVEFAPVVIRGDLLAELEDPSGLKLYAAQVGNQVKGTVGNRFRALQQIHDTALVQLPDGATGWVRMPNLSVEHSEVVDFTGGLIRMLRRDWPGATLLFTKVVNNPKTPTSVKMDAYLYLSVAADKMTQGSYRWARKAYEVNPYSKTAIQYLCMSRISDFNHMSPTDQHAERGFGLLRSLNDIVVGGSALFPANDAWLNNVKGFVKANLH